MTKGVWKTLALLALTINAIFSLGVIWAVTAFWSNMRQLAVGAPVCWDATSRSFDSVAAAQMIGRLDLVSFLLTIGGLGLAIFALMGWWLIRREAKDEARDVAANEARRIAQEFYAGKNEKRTGGGDKSNSAVHNDVAPEARSSFDPSSVSTAGAVEETGAPNARPKRRSRRSSGASKDHTSFND